ncbi:putative ATP-dependent RNA helicase TDRD12 isoform X2 [Austrofundulus limnaeus]|uniref:RNA helicase n=1 Tax=Austrofundulus limnaeus TaxID=52670 RepID=A0A2I4CX60_AUSLI|nr:PREDICTED: putative ATP-dependent RNA helicase TDRD12 isoform X2 [Austrofundulus limnaeus]
MGQEAGRTWTTEEVRVCSRFLEWLNPEPLNPDPDAADVVISPSDPRKSGILVHSTHLLEPCSSLEDAPITDVLRQVLKTKNYCTLSPSDRYSWPAVARGHNTVIISHNAEQPLSYLAPLLSHIQLNSIFTSLTYSLGPIAVLLCPGWERAQVVYDLLEESKVSKTLRPVISVLGTGKNEAKAVKIPKNCLLLVTTPFTLVRLLSCHCFLFLRMCHLILDEAEEIFALGSDQMETVLKHFQKVTCSDENVFCPKQLVVVARRWTSHLESLIGNHMPSPYTIISVPEEAALYGNVQQVILMTVESSKMAALLGVLDFNPVVGQKSLIVTNSAQEVEEVFKAVSNKSAFCLKTHEGLTHQFDFVMEQWRKDIGSGTQVILVTTNDCLKCLSIRDATCLIHYGFPTSPKVFGSRLFCMAENFRNLCEGVCSQDQTGHNSQVCRSVLLLSEKNASHVVGVLRYLKRTNALLPPELLAFAQGVQVAREDQKMDRPLCSYLKSFGFCRDSSVCPDRHQFHSQLDQSVLPSSGVIEVVPLFIKSASVFSGRMVRKDDKCFNLMASGMASYYADKKPGATELLEGCLYAVQEDDVFHRVKILSIPKCGDCLFFAVLVDFIDVGKEEEVKSHQILQLPEQFQSLPGQAIEMVICRVKPADAEKDWHPKVTRAISQKIRGLQHQSRVVLSLGNTVFLDCMVRLTKVPGMKTLINEYNVQSEILNTGMAVSNPDHLNLLRALCEGDLVNKDTENTSRLEEDSVSVQVKIKTDRAADDTPVSTPDPLLSLKAPTNHFTVQTPSLSVCESASRQKDISTSELVQSARDGEECCTSDTAVSLHLLENGLPEDPHHNNTKHVFDHNKDDNSNSTISFHPQVVWHQTLDSVILTVKLMNPECQLWDFYPDRVVYSGRVNGQIYRADLQLHQKIAADLCHLEMKSHEPVLKLVKQQQGYWEQLVTTKNIFVRYNMEYIDEDEDKVLNDTVFLEETGENNWYVNSGSGSESD